MIAILKCMGTHAFSIGAHAFSPGRLPPVPRLAPYRVAHPPRTEVRAILDALRRIVRVLRASSRSAEDDVGVSGAQLFVLSALAEGGGLSIGDLAERTHTHQSTVSGVAAHLVARRLVARSTSKEDGRRVELRLTPSGRALLRRSPGLAQDQLIEGLSRLSERRLRFLSQGLGALVAEMGLAAERPPMFFDEEEKMHRSRRKRRGA